jgi:hypothetical protein
MRVRYCLVPDGVYLPTEEIILGEACQECVAIGRIAATTIPEDRQAHGIGIVVTATTLPPERNAVAT